MAYGTLKADVIQSDTTNVPPQFNGGNGVQVGTLCRAWVNFDGTGTPAIRGSFNVSSITDNGTGDYTVNFTTALPDANYGFSVSGSQNDVGATFIGGSYGNTTRLAGSFRLVTLNGAVVYTDMNSVTVAVFR
jgi:hypothetical protein